MADVVLVVDGQLGRESSLDRKVIDVAVGILISSAGALLLTSRPSGKAYAGFWEFPGGKLEANESVEQALRRELQEEIGLTISSAPVWREQLVDYPHALVRLHFCKVRDWAGRLEMREGQAFSWEHLPVKVAPVLQGTLPVLAWLVEDQP